MSSRIESLTRMRDEAMHRRHLAAANYNRARDRVINANDDLKTLSELLKIAKGENDVHKN